MKGPLLLKTSLNLTQRSRITEEADESMSPQPIHEIAYPPRATIELVRGHKSSISTFPLLESQQSETPKRPVLSPTKLINKAKDLKLSSIFNEEQHGIRNSIQIQESNFGTFSPHTTFN